MWFATEQQAGKLLLNTPKNKKIAFVEIAALNVLFWNVSIKLFVPCECGMWLIV